MRVGGQGPRCAVVLGLLAATAASADITVGGSVFFANMYIWRGFKQAEGGIGNQTYVDVPLDPEWGFQAFLWNWTTVYGPHPRGGEWDLGARLQYRSRRSPVSLAFGVINYQGSLIPTETQLTLTIEAPGQPLKPTMTIGYDTNLTNDWLFTLGLSHTVPVRRDLKLDLSASYGHYLPGRDAPSFFPEDFMTTLRLAAELDWWVTPHIAVGPRVDLFVNGSFPDEGRVRPVGMLGMRWWDSF